MARVQRSIAALSWIDPASGLPEVDAAGDPGLTITCAKIIGKSGYRFSNFLEAWIEVDTRAGAIIGGNFSSRSDMYRGPSFLHTESAPVGNIGRKIIRTPKSVTFRQLVGCRTMAPEKIGGVVGGTIGAVAGGVLGELVAGPAGGAVLAPLGGYVGGRAGRTAAELAKVFPPIWSEVELTINVDQTFTHALRHCSFFPSLSYYAPVKVGDGTWIGETGLYSRQGASYNAVPMLDTWYERGWGPAVLASSGLPQTPGNPWGMTKPTLTTQSTLNAVPQGY